MNRALTSIRDTAPARALVARLTAARLALPARWDRMLGWGRNRVADSLRKARAVRAERPLKIVCFNPYTFYSLHTAVEASLLHALRLRGHHVRYLMCDASFPQCDICRPGADMGRVRFGRDGGNTEEACQRCQLSSRQYLADFAIEPEPIGRWITPAERTTAREWSAGLAEAEFFDARFGDWAIGGWVSSSVQTHFRRNSIDVHDPATMRIYRSFLESGLLACFAHDRLLEEAQPDLLMLFNGRMSLTRCALEVARARGIRVIAEERALPGRIRLFENVGCNSISHLEELWQRWKDVPLSESELSELHSLLQQRARGAGFEFRPFSPIGGDENEIRARLGLDHRPIWLAMTSSPDEGGQDVWSQGLFESQNHWIAALVDHARGRQDIQLVIRVHPNIGSAHSNGRNDDEVEFYRRLADDAPANVRIVHSDADVSTYSLMHIADIGLVWHSTAGLEMACLGKPVARSGGMALRGKEYLTELAPGTQLEPTLAGLGTGWTPARQEWATRMAMRHAYIIFFRQTLPLPQVRHSSWHSGEFAFACADELRPGVSPELDLIAEILGGTRDLLPDPACETIVRDTLAENAFLSRLPTARAA